MGIIGCGFGSEWHLTLYLARRRHALTRSVQEQLGIGTLSWLDHDEFRDRRTQRLTLGECRGLDFLPCDDPARQEWEHLWPQTGNVHNWDAVGRTVADPRTWILVEAKAHAGELASSCGATSEASRARITEILTRTKSYLKVSDTCDWLNGYYQYCNRLVLLHFLREHQIQAHLLFVYFTGDRHDLGSGGRDCPLDENAWRPALDVQKRHVGVPQQSPLLAFVHQMFLPAYHVPVREPAAQLDLSR